MTTMLTINIVITLINTRRHFSLRCCLLNAFSFASTTRAHALQLSLCGSTLTSGVPSERQKANEASA
jgi:hypothetical protein